MLTVVQLLKIAPHCDAERLTPMLNQVAMTWKINTTLRFAHWLAQMDEETGGFTMFVENLNYSAEGLLKTWPTRFGLATADAYAHKPEAIANKVYANRMGNGDEASGDGWLYRGRGELQVTGKAGYAAATRETGIDFLASPDLMGGLGDAGIRAAAAFWTVHGCNAMADKNDIVAITKAVNGGLINLKTRRAAYANIATVLAASPWTLLSAAPEKTQPVTDTTAPATQPVPSTPAPSPTPPAIGGLNTTSLVRMALGALGMWLLGHHVFADSNAEGAFVNGVLPVAVWAATAAWVMAKNRLHLNQFYQALAAPPPTKPS